MVWVLNYRKEEKKDVAIGLPLIQLTTINVMIGVKHSDVG